MGLGLFWYLPIAWLAYIASQAVLRNNIGPPSVLLTISLLGLLLPIRRFWRQDG